ncbi:MAG: hypothetical protein IKH30_09245 [Clostridia bacterium]|nr:hypothetical protein [Clostridia bacterium]
MEKLSELLTGVLLFFYPGVVFDAEGLTSLLLPCLAIVLLGLIISLFMKIPRASRRFAYLPIVIALIVSIAASAFFPASVMQAGSYAMEQVQLITSAQETVS